MMETDETNNLGTVNEPEVVEDPTAVTAVNSLILNYYKKFGRKRDLEQYFSLSTAQGDVQDTNSSFWKQMKSQNDSSDSGERKSGSSNELCRISIKCSVQEPSTSQDDQRQRNSDTDSPPIITEDLNIPEKESANESLKSDDNHSQKSHDGTLDTSMNKPLSPTSSITSQRKLEWDSLADVGYAHESDRKASGSSLSTLERLALKQQYSNNDTKSDMGLPTAHSTPLDGNENKPKPKKQTSRITKIYRKDIDFVEFNIPQDTTQSPPQAFNVNLTKNISFNVDNDGSLLFNDPKNNVSSPKKVSVETEVTPLMKVDREIQTSLLKSQKVDEEIGDAPCVCDRKPVMPISLNTLRRRNRRQKKLVKRKGKSKDKKDVKKENLPTTSKSMEPVSEAESFEYMPGHIYNQNQLRQAQEQTNNNKTNPVGNKSSLESSGAPTTDSSKDTKASFTKDLDKSIKLLQQTLKGHSDYSNIKKKLIKEVVERLLTSKYKDDESSTDFLSGLSYSSEKLGLSKTHQTTSSTSDANTDGDIKKPKKSILRVDKFNPNVLASSSQSAPNLPIATSCDIPILPNMSKPKELATTTETESSKEKLSTNTVFAKTSSTELYKQYLEALKKETAHKKYLSDKEKFLRQKLIGSDLVLNPEQRVHNRIKDLMKDLTRNNYDDGSGDASKLEGGAASYINPVNNNAMRKHRSHSVFTLSSGISDNGKKSNWKKKLKHEINSSASASNNDQQDCKCVNRGINQRIDVSDSSVQVNLNPHDIEGVNLDNLKASNLQTKLLQPVADTVKNIAHIVSDDQTGDIKYVCLCPSHSEKNNDQFLIYKCSRLECAKAKITKHNDNTENDTKTCSCQPSTSHAVDKKGDKCRLILLEEKSSASSVENAPDSVKFTSCTTCYNVNASPKKAVKIATRCLQTEISINPKIPEAQLSDVVFLADNECATLINEVVCEAPSNHSHVVSAKCFDKSPKFNECERHTKVKEKGIKGLPKIDEQDNLISVRSSVKTPDNFTIPITGTNVSLKVSVSSAKDNVTCIKEMCTQGTTTIQPKVCDKTCDVDCTKGVQSEASRLFAQINQLPPYCTAFSTDCNAPTPSSSKSKCSSYSHFNTHPKISESNVKRPLIRSNTDPGKFVCSPAQIYSVCHCKTSQDTNKVVIKKDVETQFGSVGVATQKSEALVTSTPASSRRTLNNNSEMLNQKISPHHSNVDAKSPRRRRPVDSDPSSCSDPNDLNLRLQDLEQHIVSTSSSSYLEYVKSHAPLGQSPSKKNDPVLRMITDLKKRYSKDGYDKAKKMKSLKEFVSVLNYLVDTDAEVPESATLTSASPKRSRSPKAKKCDKSVQLTTRCQKTSDSDRPATLCSDSSNVVKNFVDKSVQLSPRKYEKGVNAKIRGVSSDMPNSSTDSTTCEVLNKIRRECEKLQHKRCKCPSHHIKECSSSSSCDCKPQTKHVCLCKSHKSQHKHRSCHEKLKKKCIAYNLILQTSDSMASEDMSLKQQRAVLKNIVVKVPPKRKNMENVPFKEVASKFERQFSPQASMAAPRDGYPRSTRDNTSSEDITRKPDYTVGDYLKANRPEFVESSTQRQNCLKIIGERRANERATKRQFLSMQLDQRQVLSELSENELRSLATQLGVHLHAKKDKPKFMSEKEMKQHSTKIYKSLPEVVKKKEDKKKENIKKTNLLMADIFKKNLQKRTLKGDVNVSNYSSLIKI